MAAWIVLVLLVLTPVSLIGGAGVFFWLREAEERRRFVQQNRHRAFLLWDTRSGWHDFIVNNVLPSLPPDVTPCPRSRKLRLSSGHHRELWRFVGWRAWRSLPSLVVTDDDGLRVTSLHRPLARLSSCRKRDERVRRLVERRLAFLRARLPGRRARAAGGLLTSAALPGTRG